MVSALFLHMGPGFSSHVERLQLGPRFPMVDFWDQPATSGAHAYTDLVKATLNKVERLTPDGRKISLIGHSFGGYLAMAMMKAVPERINGYLFAGSVLEPVVGLMHLCRRIAQDPVCEKQLQAQMLTFCKNWPSSYGEEQFKELVALLLRASDFMRYYWAKPEAYAHYLSQAQSGPPFNFQQFVDVTLECLNQHINPHPGGSEEVFALFGAEDPLLDAKPEFLAWQKKFPNARLTRVDGAGHHVHLEWQGFPSFLSGFLSSRTI